jgi:hypothetical protein
METAMMDRSAAERAHEGIASAVPYVGAAAFAIAAAWYGLSKLGITMPREPAVQPGISVEASQRQFNAWFVTTLHQERIVTAIAIVAFVCLIATATFLRDLPARDRGTARIAAIAETVGATLWIVGNVAQLGAHRAVGLLSTHDYTTETISAVLFSFDLVRDAFELTGFALMGVGMLFFARAAIRADARAKGWKWLTAVVGIGTLALVVSYLFPIGNLSDLLLVSVGAVLMPTWLFSSGRRLMHASTGP